MDWLFYTYIDKIVNHHGWENIPAHAQTPPTTIVHYIQRQGVDVKSSPYLNPLYDLTQSNHRFSNNNYGKIR